MTAISKLISTLLSRSTACILYALMAVALIACAQAPQQAAPQQAAPQQAAPQQASPEQEANSNQLASPSQLVSPNRQTPVLQENSNQEPATPISTLKETQEMSITDVTRAIWEVHNDPNPIRQREHSGTEYRFYGTVLEIRLPRGANRVRLILKDTHPNLASEITCHYSFSDEASRAGLGKVDVGDTVLINGQVSQTFDYWEFSNCQIIETEYQPDWETLFLADEQERGLTRNNCYVLSTNSGFSYSHKQPVITIWSYEEHQPGQSDQQARIYRNRDPETLIDPFQNILEGQKPYDGYAHLQNYPEDFPHPGSTFGGIFLRMEVIDVEYDNTGPTTVALPSYQYRPDCNDY